MHLYTQSIMVVVCNKMIKTFVVRETSRIMALIYRHNCFNNALYSRVNLLNILVVMVYDRQRSCSTRFPSDVHYYHYQVYTLVHPAGKLYILLYRVCYTKRGRLRTVCNVL